jgi:hypothetical protein
MAVMNAYPHRDLINKSILAIYAALGRDRVKAHAADYELGNFAAALAHDPYQALQDMARQIASQWDVDARLDVIPCATLDAAGRVDASARSYVSIELNGRLLHAPCTVASTLAHEVAHIFLRTHRVRFGNRPANEVLTDTVAAYLGFGVLMLNGATERATRGLPEATRLATPEIGYITPCETGYILAKRDAVIGTDSLAKVAPGVPEFAFRSGRALFQSELNVVRPTRRDGCAREVIVNCPYCWRRIRIPALRRALRVRCRTCDSKFRVGS